MKRIGLLSDTHGFFDERIENYLSSCDEIWHAGDIGNIETADKYANIKPLKAVYGNIDGKDVRIVHPQHQRFLCENVDVWITHIGGYPGKYAFEVKPQIYEKPPKLFICGHSHILKVINDKKLSLLHINPGAAGIYGMHKTRTLIRFSIHDTVIKDLEVVELGSR